MREPVCPAKMSVLLQVQLRWAGNVTWMEHICMPKAVFFSKLQEGKRDRSAPRKRYKDQRKRQLYMQDSVMAAGDLRLRASCEFEAERKAAKEKRRRQKERAASLPSSSQTLSLIHI